MNTQNSKKEIEFLAGRKGTFLFECKACGRCCGEYTILLTPYDIIRLRRATSRKTSELIRGETIVITRMPLKQAFGFGPVADMFEMFGLSRDDAVPVARLSFSESSGGKRECAFLSAVEDGRRLCGIYKDRPGMCRLHPLGCVTIGGRRRWFYRRPLCDASSGKIRTVNEWLGESRMRPFLDANAHYLRWMRTLLEDPQFFDKATEEDWKALERILFDFDSIDAKTDRHTLHTIEKMFREWLAQTTSLKR
jgi:Fe-S-cluster containining protein